MSLPIYYLPYSGTKKRAKNVQKRAKTCKNMQKRASQVLIYQKIAQKRAPQIFLDPIQKRAPARSVQLEAVYLEALLYPKNVHYKALLYLYTSC